MDPCRVRRSWLFWGKLRILTFRPRTSIAPANPFSQKNAPDLRATHHDTAIPRGSGEGIKRPVSLPLLIEGFQFSTTAAHQAPGRLCSGQGNDPRAFQLREARLPADAGTIREGLSMPSALKRWRRSRTVLGWQPSSSAILAVRSPRQLKEMIRARKIQSPGAWRLPASLRILRSSSVSSGARALSSFGTVFSLPTWRFDHALMYTAFEERSTKFPRAHD